MRTRFPSWTHYLIPFLALFMGLMGSTNVRAQLLLNPGVDTTSARVKKVVSFYNAYLTDFRQDNQVDYAHYFHDEDAKAYAYPDKVAFGLLGNTTNYVMGQPHLLSVDAASDTVQLKVMFAETNAEGNINVHFIANHYIHVQQDNCTMLVTQHITTQDWHANKVRNVTFHHPPTHTFDTEKAKQLIAATVQLELDWKLPPLDIDYYYASTPQEIERIKGFDYHFGLAKAPSQTGLAYQQEQSIYCAGLGEGYFHEVVHLYLNSHYPKSPLKEGIATYYGGSTGHSLAEGLMALQAYAQANPTRNIADRKAFYYLNEDINPQYFLQGLLCHLVAQQQGKKGLHDLMELTTMDAVYQTYFGISPDQQNDFLRSKLTAFVTDHPSTQ